MVMIITILYKSAIPKWDCVQLIYNFFEFVSKKKTIKKLLFQYKKRFLSMNI